MAKQIIIAVILILAIAVTATQAHADEQPTVICPPTDHSKYCHGIHDGEKSRKKGNGDPLISCGIEGNHTKFCFKICNIGDHSSYCLGYVDALKWDDSTCGGSNHTRYCMGWKDAGAQAEIDQAEFNDAGGHVPLKYNCPPGHTTEYCDGWGDGYNDMVDVIKYDYKY